jgi:predicted nucleotidyltransferase
MRLTLLVCASLADASVGQNGLPCGSGMTRFAALREKQQALWRDQLQQRLHALASAEAPWSAALDGIWLFGSRARGDWDGWSDTDLIVVALDQQAADHWADRIAEAGIAADVIAMDRVRWQQLPTNPSALWRAVARDAVCVYRGQG